MPLDTDVSTPERSVELAREIEDIRSANYPPLAKFPDSVELPSLWVFIGSGEHSKRDPFTRDTTRIYRIQVACVVTTASNPFIRETVCRPLLETVIDYYDARPSLQLLNGIMNGKVVRDSGVTVLPEYDGQFTGFEVQFQVDEVRNVSFAANE